MVIKSTYASQSNDSYSAARKTVTTQPERFPWAPATTCGKKKCDHCITNISNLSWTVRETTVEVRLTFSPPPLPLVICEQWPAAEPQSALLWHQSGHPGCIQHEYHCWKQSIGITEKAYSVSCYWLKVKFSWFTVFWSHRWLGGRIPQTACWSLSSSALKSKTKQLSSHVAVK